MRETHTDWGKPSPDTRTDDRDRGQTTLDFVVGIGVFLLVIAFAAGFIPEMYEPLDDDPERPQVADRTADRLVATLVESPDNPAALNTTCTLTFLRQSDTACGYDPGDSLQEQLGIGPRYRVNVSVQRNETADPGLETLCTDGTSVTDCDSGSELLAVGPDVPVDRSSADAARRVVYVDGRDATVVVTIW